MIAYQQKLKLSVVAVAVSIGLAGTLAGCNDDDNNTSQVQDEDAQYRAKAEAGLTHQCLYFEQPHTFEQILFIQTAEPALVGHA